MQGIHKPGETHEWLVPEVGTRLQGGVFVRAEVGKPFATLRRARRVSDAGRERVNFDWSRRVWSESWR